jgi:hypothetical protein
MGIDTPLDIQVPNGCRAADTTVTAVDRAGVPIATVPSAPTAGGGAMVTFTVSSTLTGMLVDYFALHC